MMRKIVVSFAVMVLGLSTIVSAENIAGRSGVGIGIGYISPKDSDLKAAVIPSLNYTYGISSEFALELSIGATTLKAKSQGVDMGDVKTMPLQLTAQYRIPVNAVSPYIGAGVGYYLNSFTLSDTAKTQILATMPVGSTLEYQLKNSFGYHVNAGGDYFLNKNIALNLDARYFWSKADMTSTFKYLGTTTETTTKNDLDSFIIGAGIKYFF